MARKIKKEPTESVLKRINKRLRIKQRIKLSLLLFVLLVAIALVFLYFGLGYQASYVLNKIEKGTADYRVYLAQDDIYKNEFQESGYSYISSTINYIKAYFNYELKYDKDVETKYDYEIKSVLTIREPGIDGKVLYEEKYQEKDKSTDLVGKKDVQINEEIKIDYKKYNSVVENYKKKYGVSVNAEVKTVLILNEKSLYDEKEVLNEVRELSVTVPLGEQTLTIKTNKPINYIDSLVGERVLELNIPLVLIGDVFVFISILDIIYIILLIDKNQKLKTIYDIRLAKILKDYDRIIVETESTKIEQEFKNVISVNSFEELVDVRDNTEQPILYIEKSIGRHAYFTVINADTLYTYDFDIEKMQ